MDNDSFRKYAHELVEWMADYLDNIGEYPVRSEAEPGQIFGQIPEKAPDKGESMEQIFTDFRNIILPGMTHWQSPGFFAYFPANSSYPSVLAEMLTATLGAQCMKWETSPAAAELEEKVMNWLRDLTGLPADFEGVIQDTASTSTLLAILSAREKHTGYMANEEGLHSHEGLRVYCSRETHSSIDKAVRIAGLGSRNLVKVEVDDRFAMVPSLLKKAIEKDLAFGLKPFCVIATLGTTGSTAIDPLGEIAEICREHGIWLHVDAAYAGSALLLPEFRWMIRGIEQVDSFVFNPHKWLFTNFDCSAYFVKDRHALLRAMQIVPEYLKTRHQGKVNDYCDWSVQLGRRFRALKLWFVIRTYGVSGLQEKLRMHISLARTLEKKIADDEEFEIMAPVSLNLVCFRFRPKGIHKPDEIDEINETLLKKINLTGKLYMSHTRLGGKYALRLVTANTHLEAWHLEKAWETIRDQAAELTR